MPATPKTPLLIRLKALKEAFLWVIGNQTNRAQKIRHFTLLAPGLEGIHQFVLNDEVSSPPLNELALPLVDETLFKHWNELKTPGIKNPLEKELRDIDVRFLFLIPTINDYFGSKNSFLENLFKTALRMAWKNQTQDRSLLSMAQYLIQKNRLSELEKTQFEMALSFEEIVPPCDAETFLQNWNYLSTQHKVYLKALGVSLNVPLDVYPSPTLSLFSLDEGLKKTGLNWLAWTSLFNSFELLEHAIEEGAKISQLTELSDWMQKIIQKELDYWKTLAVQIRQNQIKIAQENNQPGSIDVNSLFHEYTLSDLHLLHEKQNHLKIKDVNALHWAYLMNSKQSIQILLRYGMDPNISLNYRTANGLALSMMREEWNLALELIKAGHRAKWNAKCQEKEEQLTWLFIESPIVCLTRHFPSSQEGKNVYQKLCEQFNQESPNANDEWRFTYFKMIEKNLVEPFGYLLNGRERQSNYVHPLGTEDFESGDLWVLFEGEKGPKIEFLKEIAKHDVKLSDHAWRLDKHNFSTFILWPLLAWAPEALEEWLKHPHNQTLLPLILQKRALSLKQIPTLWQERVVCPNRWAKDDTHWTVAAHSTNPKLALSLLQQHQAPIDCLYEKDHQSIPRDIWQIALNRKSDTFLVEWICKTWGAPNWNSDYPIAEYVKWTEMPRNQVEIENVLNLNVLPLNQPINQQGDTLLHRAVEKQDEWLISQWASAGGDLDLPNQKGVTPRQLAQQMHWGESILAHIDQICLEKRLPHYSDTSSTKKKHL